MKKSTVDELINSTIKDGVIKLPKNIRNNKDKSEYYNQLTERIWTMVVHTLFKSPSVASEKEIMDRIFHSIKVSKLVYKIGKEEIKDDYTLVDLQLAALMHDMFKFYNVNHGEQAATIAIGLGLSKEICNAIASHSNKGNKSQSIYTLVLMDADNISKLSPEYLLQFVRSGNSRDKLETKKKVYTKTGKDIFKVKLKELELFEKIFDMEKSLN